MEMLLLPHTRRQLPPSTAVLGMGGAGRARPQSAAHTPLWVLGAYAEETRILMAVHGGGGGDDEVPGAVDVGDEVRGANSSFATGQAHGSCRATVQACGSARVRRG